MNARERELLRRLDWIANLAPETCPGGAPTCEREWRDLVNRMVLEVRQALRAVARGSDKSDKSDRSDRSDGSDGSDKSDRSDDKPGLIPAHGGYRRLRSFQVASLVYDATVIFCERFIPRQSRTRDQMVQAARSGRQNIAEGSMASATSKKTELKLTNVAKASLEELLLDCEDFLRQRGLRQWAKDAPEARAVRQRFRSYPAGWFREVDSSDRSDKSDLSDPYEIAAASPEVAANTLLCLINQAIYLLKRQIEVQEKSFLADGGFTERLYKARRAYRDNPPGTIERHHSRGDRKKG